MLRTTRYIKDKHNQKTKESKKDPAKWSPTRKS
jgi:hypothetical protein